MEQKGLCFRDLISLVLTPMLMLIDLASYIRSSSPTEKGLFGDTNFCYGCLFFFFFFFFFKERREMTGR